jgi:hypothetical protein
MAFGRRHGAQGAHIVRAVGQLDHDDANVAHHGQQHLAKAFCLGFGATFELHLIQLRHAIDDLGDFLAEFLGDLGFGGGRIFDDIVQDGCNDGLAIHMQIGKQVGDRYRMRDVRLAAAALLAFMRGGAEFIGFADVFYLLGRQVAFQFIE